jgi:prephenate dehydrogenase
MTTFRISHDDVSASVMTILPVIQPGRPREAPRPVFDKVAIVGLGLIGGSIALAARQIWPTSLVIGVDRKDVLEEAMRRHAIDVAADDLVVLAEADLVILSAPPRQNIALLADLDDNVRQPAVVTDTSGTKRAIVDAARALPPRFTFVGGHPLGGAAKSGLEHARADLFSGRPWLLTPTGDGVGAAVDKLSAFVRALGSEPHVLDARAHDRLLAYLSHLPQLTASALMQVVGEAAGDRGLALAGRGLVDTTRLASSPVEIWRDIAATNADEIGPALDALIAVLQGLRRDLTGGDQLNDVFARANRWRDQLKKATPSTKPT